MKPMFVVILFFVALLTDGGAMASDRAWPPTWSSQHCKCIKNVNGVCMTLSRRGMPRFSRGSGTQNQFLPNSVEDCLPGSTLTTGTDQQTEKELAHCYVDWNRLKQLNPQWSDRNWTP
jgi:hypothetical protein